MSFINFKVSSHLFNFILSPNQKQSYFYKHISKCETHALQDTHRDGQKEMCKVKYLKCTRGTYFLKGSRVTAFGNKGSFHGSTMTRTRRLETDLSLNSNFTVLSGFIILIYKTGIIPSHSYWMVKCDIKCLANRECIQFLSLLLCE